MVVQSRNNLLHIKTYKMIMAKDNRCNKCQFKSLIILSQVTKERSQMHKSNFTLHRTKTTWQKLII